MRAPTYDPPISVRRRRRAEVFGIDVRELAGDVAMAALLVAFLWLALVWGVAMGFGS